MTPSFISPSIFWKLPIFVGNFIESFLFCLNYTHTIKMALKFPLFVNNTSLFLFSILEPNINSLKSETLSDFIPKSKGLILCILEIRNMCIKNKLTKFHVYISNLQGKRILPTWTQWPIWQGFLLQKNISNFGCPTIFYRGLFPWHCGWVGLKSPKLFSHNANSMFIWHIWPF